MSTADGVALGLETVSARKDNELQHDCHRSISLEERKPQISSRDAVVITYDASGWPLTFRSPGSPAGTFPHCTWWHCTSLLAPLQFLCWNLRRACAFWEPCGLGLLPLAAWRDRSTPASTVCRCSTMWMFCDGVCSCVDAYFVPLGPDVPGQPVLASGGWPGRHSR